VLEAIAKGREQGARLLYGGSRPENQDKGYFLTPAIFADRPEDSWICKEEIFGPVVCVRPFDDEADVFLSVRGWPSHDCNHQKSKCR
jgi:betaine-aldehyde dehydrogenase